MKGNFSIIYLILSISCILSCVVSAVIKKQKIFTNRNLKVVELDTNTLTDKHMPSRYLRLKKFMKTYSKKAGVQLADPNAHRKLCK